MACVHISVYISNLSSDIFLNKTALVYSSVLLLSFLSVLHRLWQCALVYAWDTHICAISSVLPGGSEVDSGIQHSAQIQGV